MKIRKILNSILVLAFMAAVLWVAQLIIKRSDQRMVEQAVVTTSSTGTESITTYNFGNDALTGRVSALGVGAAENGQGLRARCNTVLANGLSRAIKVRNIQAVTHGGDSLSEFHFSFEKAQVSPGRDYAFSGTAPVDPEFFNSVVRKFDMALRIETDIGVLELPLQIYTLEVEPALAAGLLKTNHVSFGEAEGIINFLNCEQASAAEVCEPMLLQMAAP